MRSRRTNAEVGIAARRSSVLLHNGSMPPLYATLSPRASAAMFRIGLPRVASPCPNHVAPAPASALARSRCSPAAGRGLTNAGCVPCPCPSPGACRDRAGRRRVRTGFRRGSRPERADGRCRVVHRHRSGVRSRLRARPRDVRSLPPAGDHGTRRRAARLRQRRRPRRLPGAGRNARNGTTAAGAPRRACRLRIGSTGTTWRCMPAGSARSGSPT